jgi:hypothetical protein
MQHATDDDYVSTKLELDDGPILQEFGSALEFWGADVAAGKGQTAETCQMPDNQ